MPCMNDSTYNAAINFAIASLFPLTIGKSLILKLGAIKIYVTHFLFSHLLSFNLSLQAR